MPDINSVSVTYHDERKREEYGPMKKAEATITATVNAGEDGAAVLDQIAYIATTKVRAMLTIEGAQAVPAVVQVTPQATAPAAEQRTPEGWGATQAQPSPQVEPPAPKIRRNSDEIARGLTVEQALAERAAKAAGNAPQPAAAPATPASDVGTAAEAGSPDTGAATSAGNEWDGPASVEITDEELNKHCAATAERIGDPIKVRNTKELYNPNPGQPFRVVEIPQDKRADFIAKLATL